MVMEIFGGLPETRRKTLDPKPLLYHPCRFAHAKMAVRGAVDFFLFGSSEDKWSEGQKTKKWKRKQKSSVDRGQQMGSFWTESTNPKVKLGLNWI
jgi:hypothetical protein